MLKANRILSMAETSPSCFKSVNNHFINNYFKIYDYVRN